MQHRSPVEGSTGRTARLVECPPPQSAPATFAGVFPAPTIPYGLLISPIAANHTAGDRVSIPAT